VLAGVYVRFCVMVTLFSPDRLVRANHLAGIEKSLIYGEGEPTDTPGYDRGTVAASATEVYSRLPELHAGLRTHVPATCGARCSPNEANRPCATDLSWKKPSFYR
jgi:hypothetical protein